MFSFILIVKEIIQMSKFYKLRVLIYIINYKYIFHIFKNTWKCHSGYFFAKLLFQAIYVNYFYEFVI